MKVSEIMTGQVLTVRPTDSIEDAIRLMITNRISGLPVVNKAGGLVGIITEGDLLRRPETSTTRHRSRWIQFLLSPGKLAEEYAHTHGRRVDEVMTSDVVSTNPDASLDVVVQLMEQRGIKRLPVVREGRIVGIVSRANLLHAFLAIADVPLTLSSDATIRQSILDEILREPWGPRYSINVVVTAGRVDLSGSLFEEQERKALRVVCENVPGVKSVHDHMVWVEPTMGIVVDAPEECADEPALTAR